MIFKRENKNPLKIDTDKFKDLKFSEYFKKHEAFMNTISIEQLEKVFNQTI